MSINTLSNNIVCRQSKLNFYLQLSTPTSTSATVLVPFNSNVGGIIANVPFVIIASLNLPNGGVSPTGGTPSGQCSLEINGVAIPYSPPQSLPTALPTALVYTYQCISPVNNPSIFVYWDTQNTSFNISPSTPVPNAIVQILQ